MKFIGLITIVLFFGGCVSFDKNEKKLLYTYHKNDILVFKSVKTGKEKSFEISKVDESSSGYSEAHLGPGRQGTISYVDKANAGHEHDLMSIYKDNDSTNIDITFEYFYVYMRSDLGTINNNDSICEFSKKYKDYYEIYRDTSNNNNYTDEYIMKIYWQKDIGIVKYDLYGGDSYIRIN